MAESRFAPAVLENEVVPLVRQVLQITDQLPALFQSVSLLSRAAAKGRRVGHVFLELRGGGYECLVAAVLDASFCRRARHGQVRFGIP